MSALRTQVRALSRRTPVRSSIARPARSQRGYATDEPPPSGGKAGGFPVAGILAAVSIPALAWFFMGRSPATAGKGPEMKDARTGESAADRGAGRNEEKSASVPSVKPEEKETKPANPKAVVGDEQRLGTEKAEKTNTLTGQGK